MNPQKWPNKVTSIQKLRDSAPADVWDWQSYKTWSNDIWSILDDILDENVKEEFLLAPPEYIVGDNLGWLDEIITRATGKTVDVKSVACERIRRHFKALRSYHGTNTKDLPSFFCRGLLPLDPASIHRHAKDVFLTDDFPEVTEGLLGNAIKEVETNTRANRVWFECNEFLLVESCGHYMLYGSEYLLGIAACLKGKRDYRRALKNQGNPTVLICDVPLTLIEDHILDEFAGNALEIIFQELLDGNSYRPDIWRGAGYYIQEKLPPESIIGYYHPDSVKDPIM